MIELRKALKEYLKAIHPNVTIDDKAYSRVHFQAAPKKTPYPYLVFDFPNTLTDGEYKDNVVVDIDGWGDDSDTTELESLMALVNGNGELASPTGLDKKTLISSSIAVRFGLENKLPLTDDDPRIHRWKYVYQARIFKRG